MLALGAAPSDSKRSGSMRVERPLAAQSGMLARIAAPRDRDPRPSLRKRPSSRAALLLTW